MTDPIAAWYRDKDEEARRLVVELEDANVRLAAAVAEVKRIEAALERARYVGD